MTTRFNLIDEPFLPVVVDCHASLLGIRAALTQAHEITELRDESPLVTAALTRFLLVILHRSLKGPEDEHHWKRLWTAGKFPEAEIDTYLEQFRERFNLFHATRPFLQSAPKADSELSGADRLVIERSQTHCNKHFSHTDPDSRPLMPPDEAARQLIAHQAFAPQGGSGYQSAWTANCAVLMLRGGTLFETLCLNLMPYPDSTIFPDIGKDQPAWERDALLEEDAEIPGGYTDYMTWSFRRIWLCASPEGQVTGAHYAKGRRMNLDESDVRIDPMVAYRRNTKDTSKPDRPVGFVPEKALWRDLGVLLTFADAGMRAASVLRNLKSLVTWGHLPRSTPVSLSAYGYYAEPAAKLQFWRGETLPLPLRYLDDETSVGLLKCALSLAEQVGTTALYQASKIAAEIMLGSDPDAKPKPKTDAKRLAKLIAALSPERRYWADLERPFRDSIVGFASGVVTLERWFFEFVKPVAWRAFGDTFGRLDGARELKAVTYGLAKLNVELTRIQSVSRIANTVPEGSSK